MAPSTASRMPRIFCGWALSILSSIPNIAVNTGIVGCIQDAINTPDISIPMIYNNCAKNIQNPRKNTFTASFRTGTLYPDTMTEIANRIGAAHASRANAYTMG